MSKPRIRYNIQGFGEPIILLHGWGGSSKSLKKLQEFLAKDFQAITLDLPGFGQSPEPQETFGVKDYAQEVVQVAKDLKLKKFHLFGHSFGGQIAARLTLDYPQIINTLALCDAAVVRKKAASTKIIIRISKLMKQIGLSPLLKIILRNSDYQKSSPNMKKIMNKVLTEDLTPYLQQIHTPTLILWGEKDYDTPLWQARIIHQGIKGSKLKVYPEYSHGLPLTNPEKVASEIKEFIK